MNRLGQLRKELKITQRQLEEYVDMPHSILSDLENEKRPFRQIHIEKLTNFFRVTSDYLLGKSNSGYLVSSYNLIDDFIFTEEEYKKYIENIYVCVRNSDEYCGFKTVHYNNSKIVFSSLDTNFYVERIINVPYELEKKEIRNELLDLLLVLDKSQQEKVIKFIKEYIL